MSKILIIEDEEAIADLEKDYLELSGFEVTVENRGDTGLKAALEEMSARKMRFDGWHQKADVLKGEFKRLRAS